MVTFILMPRQDTERELVKDAEGVLLFAVMSCEWLGWVEMKAETLSTASLGWGGPGLILLNPICF